MAPWLEEYLHALKERDINEKAELDTYNIYTRLADRAATLDPNSPTNHQIIPSPQTPPSRPPSDNSNSSAVAGGRQQPSATDRDALGRIQDDLSEAQRSRGAIQLQLQSLNEETKKLRLRSKADGRRINELVSERTHLTTRRKDQDEELRGKAKLLEDVHDETVALTLQLNMAEEKCRKLERENKELVDRWMARMGEEADALNNASKFS